MSNRRAAKLQRSRRRGMKRTHEPPPRDCQECAGAGCRTCAGTGAGTLGKIADRLERAAWWDECPDVAAASRPCRPVP